MPTACTPHTAPPSRCLPFSLALRNGLVLLATGVLLSACGDGVRGHFVWGDKPDGEDNSGVVIVVTHAPQEGPSQLIAQQPVEAASAAVQAELARLHTTNATTCATGDRVLALTLETPTGTQHYLSSNGDCAAAPAGVAAGDFAGFIPAQDLAYFANLLAQTAPSGE